MPIVKKDGSDGLLKSGEFGEAIIRELPFYDVSQIEDQQLLLGEDLYYNRHSIPPFHC